LQPAVVAGRQHAALAGQRRDTGHPLLVGLGDALELSARRDVPDADSTLIASADQALAVGGERQRADGPLGSAEPRRQPRPLAVPEAEDAVVAAAGDVAAVRGGDHDQRLAGLLARTQRLDLLARREVDQPHDVAAAGRYDPLAVGHQTQRADGLLPAPLVA